MLTAAIGRVQSLDQDKESKDPGGAAHRGSQSFICAPMSGLGLFRVAPTSSKASPNVRYAFNSDRICAAQRTVAKCQEETSRPLPRTPATR